jgi:hypothetical protein
VGVAGNPSHGHGNEDRPGTWLPECDRVLNKGSGNLDNLWERWRSGVQCERVGRQGSGGLSHVSHGSVLQTPPLPLPLLPLLPPHPFPLPLHHREGDCVSTVDMHRKDERDQQIQLLIQVESGTPNNLSLLFLSRVEASITHYLRYYAPYLEKYKVGVIFPMHEDRNQEDHIFLGYFIPRFKIL